MKENKAKEKLSAQFDKCQDAFEAWQGAKTSATHAKLRETDAENAYNAAKKEWDKALKECQPGDIK